MFYGVLCFDRDWFLIFFIFLFSFCLRILLFCFCTFLLLFLLLCVMVYLYLLFIRFLLILLIFQFFFSQWFLFQYLCQLRYLLPRLFSKFSLKKKKKKETFRISLFLIVCLNSPILIVDFHFYFNKQPLSIYSYTKYYIGFFWYYFDHESEISSHFSPYIFPTY